MYITDYQHTRVKVHKPNSPPKVKLKKCAIRSVQVQKAPKMASVKRKRNRFKTLALRQFQYDNTLKACKSNDCRLFFLCQNAVLCTNSLQKGA